MLTDIAICVKRDVAFSYTYIRGQSGKWIAQSFCPDMCVLIFSFRKEKRIKLDSNHKVESLVKKKNTRVSGACAFMVIKLFLGMIELLWTQRKWLSQIYWLFLIHVESERDSKHLS